MAIHLHFFTAIELFQHCNKYADHKIFHDAFERGEYLSYNSAFLASISIVIAIVIRAPVNVFCNAGVDVRLLTLYNCCIKPETEENPEIFLFWLSSSGNPSDLDHFVPLMKESCFTKK